MPFFTVNNHRSSNTEEFKFGNLRPNDPITSVNITLAINNDDKEKVGELLKDFDPNSTIRNKPVIGYVRTREMLHLLLECGLDLSINKPLVNCKCCIFKDLIFGEFKIDIFSDYKNVRGWKKRELTKLLIKKRGELLSLFSGTILSSNMRKVVVDSVYPCPEI